MRYTNTLREAGGRGLRCLVHNIVDGSRWWRILVCKLQLHVQIIESFLLLLTTQHMHLSSYTPMRGKHTHLKRFNLLLNPL